MAYASPVAARRGAKPACRRLGRARGRLGPPTSGRHRGRRIAVRSHGAPDAFALTRFVAAPNRARRRPPVLLV